MARKMKFSYNDVDGTGLFQPLDGAGETIEGVEFRFNINDYSPAMQSRAQGRGFSDVYQDCYAGITEAAAMVAAMTTRHTAMLGGTWTAKGEGGSRITDLARDVATATGETLEDVIVELAKMTKDERKTLGKLQDVVDARVARQAEEAAAKLRAAKKAAKGRDPEDVAPTAAAMFAGLRASADESTDESTAES